MKQTKPIEDLPAFQAGGMPWKWRLLFVVLIVGPALYFGSQGDYVVAAILAAAGISALAGFRIGAAGILTSVAAIAAAISYAPTIGYQQEWRFTEWFGTTGLLNRFISVGAIGLTITVATSCLAALIAGRLFRNLPSLERANRWLGFWIGAVEGVAAAVLLLGGALILEPIEQERSTLGASQSVAGQQISRSVVSIAQHAHSSRIGPYLERYNPFVCFPRLNKIEQVQKSVQILSNPEKIERLLRHPEVQQLQSRPEVRTAVRKVMEDPQIRTALHCGAGMNRSTAMMMLNHPAILELVDQPGFMSVVSKAIQNSRTLGP